MRASSLLVSPILFVGVVLLVACLGASAPPATVEPPAATASGPAPTSTSSLLPSAAATDTPLPATATATEPATALPPSSATAPRPPTLSPAPGAATPTFTPRPFSAVWESSVTFQAYPYERFMQTRTNPRYAFSFPALDRGAYDAAPSALAPRTVRAIVLENEYLRLTFLPDLGGRLFQVTFKPTGQNLLYNNHVLKPTHWGPADQGGWLAVGGLEWALPVNEHGYEWGTAWQTSVTRDAAGDTLVLTDTNLATRVRARVTVTLPHGAAYFVAQPRVENPTSSPVSLQFWENAQINLGAAGRLPPGLRFSFPADSAYIHSTASTLFPARLVPTDNATHAADPIPWPQALGRDLSLYGNWDNYLGLFAVAATHPYAGAYNPDTALGLARVFPPAGAPAVKLFAFGRAFCCWSEFADDGSEYFELWGGLPRTFFSADDVTLRPGEAREWTESWIPFVHTGGLSAASRDAVLSLQPEGTRVRVGAYSALPRPGTLVLLKDGAELRRWPVTLSPSATFTADTSSPGSGRYLLRFLDSQGTLIVEAASP